MPLFKGIERERHLALKWDFEESQLEAKALLIR